MVSLCLRFLEKNILLKRRNKQKDLEDGFYIREHEHAHAHARALRKFSSSPRMTPAYLSLQF